MSRIVICVEPNEIAVEHTKQQLVTDGQDSVDFAAREGSMEEKSDLDIFLAIPNLLAKHFRKKHEVIVMDPDQVSILDFFRNGFGKKAVRFLVCLPGRFVECNFTWMVMKKWPQDRI
jgi:hypothetical protein